MKRMFVALGVFMFAIQVYALNSPYGVIIVDKMKFRDAPSEVHVNEIIIWKNNDAVQHSATAVDGSFDVNLPAHQTGKTTINHVGTIKYICKYHLGMSGELIIIP